MTQALYNLFYFLGEAGAVTLGYCQVACSVIMLMALRGIVTGIHQSEARDVISGPMRGLQSVITGIRAQHSQGLGSSPWPHLCSLQYWGNLTYLYLKCQLYFLHSFWCNPKTKHYSQIMKDIHISEHQLTSPERSLILLFHC